MSGSVIRRYGNLSSLFWSFILCVTGYSLFSQASFQYIWPIDSPFVITGNYGELRPNHFHAGIDFSTRGQINLPVYAVEEGYVSRIRVSPYGYGKCVYITHPNGKVSVYAHLNSFSLKIANKAKENQYDTQSFEIDYMLKPRTVYVRKNEIIGLSGNTGGSTGPHLHFELRDELTEIPSNPLTILKTKDRTPPELQHIAFYNLSDSTTPKFMHSYRVKESGNDSAHLEDDHLVLHQSIVGLSFAGLDRVYPNGNPNNVFAASVFLDDKLIYTHKLEGISFDDTRYINEFSETIGKHKYQKCFLPSFYPPGFSSYNENRGRIVLPDSAYHKVKLVLSDENGNERKIQFYVRVKHVKAYTAVPMEGDVYVKCTEELLTNKKDIRLQILARTLYYSSILNIENTLDINGKLKIVPPLNLRQAVNIGFKVPEKFLDHKDKLLLKGSSSNAVGQVRGDSVFFAVKEFDHFYLVVDTIPPKIKMDYSPRKLKDAWKMDSFSFTISDNQSGVGKYNVWLNNSWVLAEYDAKSDQLTYYFDEETPIGLLNFKVEVQDKAGNKTFFEYVLKK